MVHHPKSPRPFKHLIQRRTARDQCAQLLATMVTKEEMGTKAESDENNTHSIAICMYCCTCHLRICYLLTAVRTFLHYAFSLPPAHEEKFTAQ